MTHPELVEQGLIVLARQLETGSGPLDLLCLDKGGRLAIVELKKDQAYREAFAQALDYTARIAAMSYDDFEKRVDSNRSGQKLEGTLAKVLGDVLGDRAEDWIPGDSEPRMILVGSGADESLHNMVEYLNERYEVPVNGVFFDVSRTLAGGTLLVRSGVVADETAAKQGTRRGRGGITYEELLSAADAFGTRSLVEPVLDGWLQATGRRGRAERARQTWSLAKRSKGTAVAAYVFPYDREDPTKRAWFALVLSALADDLGTSEEEVRAGLKAADLQLEDDEWIDISTAAAVNRVVNWITTAYRKSQE